MEEQGENVPWGTNHMKMFQKDLSGFATSLQSLWDSHPFRSLMSNENPLPASKVRFGEDSGRVVAPRRLVEVAWESLHLTHVEGPTGGPPAVDAPETRLLCESRTFSHTR